MIRVANHYACNTRVAQVITVIAAMFFSAAAFAQPVTPSTSRSDEQSLQRGAIEDATPQQKYNSAIREAGGAYKEALRECAQAKGAERLKCNRDAKATYDRDMAEARRILDKGAVR